MPPMSSTMCGYIILLVAVWAVVTGPVLSEENVTVPPCNCDDGYSCHPKGHMCYADPVPVTAPSFWLGLGPDECNRQPSDCEVFGEFVYDSSHIHGDGDWCDPGGMKIRCVAKPAPPPVEPTPANVLKILTYNIYERPFVVSMDGQRERTCRIPTFVSDYIPDFDVIAFQETFVGGCWPEPHNASLRTLLAHHGFPYHTDTVDSMLTPTSGGVFLASRWPIIDKDTMLFKKALWKSADYLAAKGVSYGKILKTVDGKEQVYHVMSTHLQSGILDDNARAVRAEQTAEWGRYVKEKNIPANEPVIFAGDFNERDDADNMIVLKGNLNAKTPPRTDAIRGTTHPGVNDLLKLTRPGGEPHWIDYVLYSTNHCEPKESSMETLMPRDKAFPVCWCEQCVSVLRDYTFPLSKTCEMIEYIRDLSDHLAVMATFYF